MRTAVAITLALTAAAIASTEFRGTLRVEPDWTYVKRVGSSTVLETIGRLVDQAHTDGTNANQMTAFVRSAGTIYSNQTHTVDLTAAQNSFGDTVEFVRINFMAVKSLTTSTDALAVGGAETNEFATWLGGTNDTAIVRPGGILMLTAPGATGYVVGTNGNMTISIPNSTTNSVVNWELYFGGAE
jgi:hypothetical protein